MSEWCKKHEVEFDEDEGCRCCYSEWLIISEFVKHIDKIIGECQNYQQYFEELIMMKEFYEEKLK